MQPVAATYNHTCNPAGQLTELACAALVEYHIFTNIFKKVSIFIIFPKNNKIAKNLKKMIFLMNSQTLL